MLNQEEMFALKESSFHKKGRTFQDCLGTRASCGNGDPVVRVRTVACVSQKIRNLLGPENGPVKPSKYFLSVSQSV